VVESLKQSKSREPPPLLFDLTSLQRTANKRFGLSAKDTLEAAQALYERFKVLTYPRTDSRHLTGDMAKEIDRIVGGVEKIADYAGFAHALLEQPPRPGKRVFDDAKVSDHHAIIPTGKPVDPKSLGRDEQRIFDLVVRRFLGAFYPDAEFAQTEVVVRVGPDAGGDTAAPVAGDAASIASLPPLPDRFVARGKVRLVAGWQEVAGFGDDADDKPGKKGKKKDEDEDESATSILPPLAEGERLSGDFATVAKKTKPPSRHTEATLLSAMENAGKLVDDEEMRAAMKDSGLGTPATRASIIETLLKRTFVAARGKAPGANAHGHRAHRSDPCAEFGLARADRELGGAPCPHRPRGRTARSLHGRHRFLREGDRGCYSHHCTHGRRARHGAEAAKREGCAYAASKSQESRGCREHAGRTKRAEAWLCGSTLPRMQAGSGDHWQARLGVQPLARGLQVCGVVRRERQETKRGRPARHRQRTLSYLGFGVSVSTPLMGKT
jgi:hypothetical protein